MFKNIEVNQELLDYISEFGYQQDPIQKEIIQYNKSLRNQERLQLSVSQANLLQTMIRLCKIEECLEIGTFTGYSALSMALALPENGRVTTLDNDEKNISIAKSFFEKAKLDGKVMTILGPALDSLKKFKHDKKLFKPCAAPWGSVHINTDGTLFPCLAVDMGNVRDGLENVIKGEKFEKFRSLIKKEGTVEACNRCGWLQSLN